MELYEGTGEEGGSKSSISDSVSDSESELTFSTPAKEQRKKRERNNTKFGDISGISGLKAQHDISSEGEPSGGTNKEVKKPRLAESIGIRILSLNIGLKSDLAGLGTLIKVHKLDLVLLQEVRISEEQLNQEVGHLGFTGKVNVDAENPMKPGTALVWRYALPVTQVSTIVPCRAQYAVLESLAILNIYAPSGSEKRGERGLFFAREVFQTLSLNTGCL